MKKRIKLRKEVIGVIIFMLAMVCFFKYAEARFEKIENGEMVLVNQNEMYK